MRYFDTSFLMPVFIQEAFSARVEKVLKRPPVGEAAVSNWTRVEFSSALARQVRMDDLDRATAADIESDFDAMVNDTFVILSPNAGDFDLARTFLRRYDAGLRAGDALHLAIASNRSAETIYSLDRGLLRAGRLLGLPVDSGGRLP
jgi:predicted nucleic acid-binding protein